MSVAAVGASPKGRVLVAGSLAFDFIMHFDGRFQDHILADRLDSINLSFLVNRARKERGGCSGNVAHTMALLGEPPRVVAAVGSDFEKYEQCLVEMGVDVSCIHHFEDELTATCTITSDTCSNQLTFVSVGAMARAREINLADCVTKDTELLLVSPDDPQAMDNYTAAARDLKVPFIYDPSFQVIAFDSEQLLRTTRGAKALIVNDYEFSLFLEKTKLTIDELKQMVEMVIVTKGGDGSVIYAPDGQVINVKPAVAAEVADPTGAGDSFRGGLIYGLLHGKSLEECARIGNICGVYAVESIGTQNFNFTKEAFAARYRETYGEELQF